MRRTPISGSFTSSRHSRPSLSANTALGAPGRHCSAGHPATSKRSCCRIRRIPCATSPSVAGGTSMPIVPFVPNSSGSTTNLTKSSKALHDMKRGWANLVNLSGIHQGKRVCRWLCLGTTMFPAETLEVKGGQSTSSRFLKSDILPAVEPVPDR